MTATVYPHLNDLAQAAMLLSVPERSRWTCRDRFIFHEQVTAIFTFVRMLVCSEGRVRARGLVVSGVGGSGKTMIANAILREYPELGSSAEEEGSQRVVRITMTNAREASKIFSRTLRALGCPNIASYTHDEREELVVELLKAAKTRLLIIDEIQDLLKRSDAQRENTFEGIKFLMNEAGVAVLALGTDRAEMAMMREEHLVTRFRSIKLAKWRAGPLMANFLDEMEASLPLPERSRLSLPTTQRFLAKVSNGRLDLIVERVVFAAALAIEDGADRVTMRYLERSALEIPKYFSGREPEKKGGEGGMKDEAA